MEHPIDDLCDLLRRSGEDILVRGASGHARKRSAGRLRSHARARARFMPKARAKDSKPLRSMHLARARRSRLLGSGVRVDGNFGSDVALPAHANRRDLGALHRAARELTGAAIQLHGRLEFRRALDRDPNATIESAVRDPRDQLAVLVLRARAVESSRIERTPGRLGRPTVGILTQGARRLSIAVRRATRNGEHPHDGENSQRDSTPATC